MKKLLLLLLLFAAPANATTFYVRTGGNNSHTCTQAQTNDDTHAKQTINAGMSCMSASDTVVIGSGTYGENLDNEVGSTNWVSGSAGNPTIVKAAPGATVTVNGSGNHVVTIANRSYITIDGLTIDGINTNPVTNPSSVGVKICCTSNHIRFINGEVMHGGQVVQIADAGTDNNEVSSSNIHHADATAAGGGSSNCFYVGEASNLIARNQIHDCHGYGIQVYNQSQPTSASNNVIRDNQIYNTDLDLQAWGGLIVSSGSNNLVYNNIVRDAQGTSFGVGIDVQYSCVNCQVLNNTIYQNNWFGINVGSTASGSILKNNIIYLNGAGTIQDGGSGTVASNNITANPLFVNAGAGNFNLQAGSPAIGAGANMSAIYTTDYAGNTWTVPYGSGALQVATPGTPIVTKLPSTPTALRLGSGASLNVGLTP